MESQYPNRSSNKNLYPQIIESNPDSSHSYPYTSPAPSAPSLYPSLDDLNHDFKDDLILDTNNHSYNPNILTSSFDSSEEVLLKIPGSIIHLIDKNQSIELASGNLEIIRLRQGTSVVAVLARVADVIQWPLAKDEHAVKLDQSHYFFTLRLPPDQNYSDHHDPEDNFLNYGLTVPGHGSASPPYCLLNSAARLWQNGFYPLQQTH